MPASEQLTPEVRRHFRRVPVLWSGRLDRGPDATSCKILNVSPGGARLRMSDAEPCPSRVTLDCAHFGRVQGKVVWGWAVGLTVRGGAPATA